MKGPWLLVVSILALYVSACGSGSTISGERGGGGGPQVATHFTVTAPATAAGGSPFNITVLALDASNNFVAGYSGTVHFTSSDPQAVLPGNSTLTSGTKVFSATLVTIGNQTITATDTVTPAITGSSNSIQVATTSNPSAPSIIDTALPIGGLNLPFEFQFTVANGLQPFTWMETGELPAGLVLSAQGELSGIPTAAGSFPIAVSLQDSLGQSAAPLAVTIQISPRGFQATGDMETRRMSHTATLLADGRVLIAGGFNNFDGSGNLATAELFDPATGTFTAAGTMTTARWSFTATLLAHGSAATDGKVLLAGGPVGNTAELFDPAVGTFTATGTMSGSRSEHTATLLTDGRVLLAGGGGTSLTAELFDPATGTFTATGAMIEFRIAPTATPLNDGRVLITGGYDSDLDEFSTAEIYDPATETFTATAGTMTTARSEHAATLLNNGKVLVTGGIGADGGPLSSAELFDPTTGTFSPTADLGSPHAFHTATVLNGGTVLVAGGFLSPNPPGDASATAEVFDPTTNTFTPTGSMGTARYLHTATRLKDGQVLMTGGLLKTNPTLVLNSAELYK